VGVRLIGATAKDATKVTRQLGAERTSLDSEPDIVIRFAERLSAPAITYLGLNSTAFTDDGFYVLDKNKGEIQAQIPFDRIGGPCELLCINGLDSIPLLMDIVRFAFLAKRYVPLHAAAFRYGQAGVLVMGWAKGGKTEALLAFANHGAQYVGDEWVLLSADERMMYGLPVSVAIRDWHVAHIPKLLPRVSLEHRVLFTVIRSLERLYAIWGRTPWRRSLLRRMLGRGLPRLRQQLIVRRHPRDLFRDRYCDGGVAMDKVFLTMSHGEPDVRVTPADPLDVARRMVASVVYEHAQFFEYYEAFLFSFPRRRNAFLDEMATLHEKLLCQALEGTEAYEVKHPYPFSFEALFDAMRPFVDASDRETD
jgi:hypothetical protein